MRHYRPGLSGTVFAVRRQSKNFAPLTFRSSPYYHCSNVRTALQRVGNSQGVIIPKPILAQVGFEREVDIDVEDGMIVLRKPNRHPREGWADASRALAASGDDALVWPEFPNEGDAELIW